MRNELCVACGQGGRPPAWQQQEPPANRPVYARQLHIGEQLIRHDAVNKCASPRIWQARRGAVAGRLGRNELYPEMNLI